MPTYSNTTKYALRRLLGSNIISDIDAGIAALADDVDSNMAGYATGTFAGKPAAGKAGRWYLCTDTGQWLADTGSAWVDANMAPQFVSSLPGSPYDGQEIYYQADLTNGVIWHLRYRAASASAYKWESVGCSAPLTAEVATLETTSSATFVDLATVGPSITVPLAGDYEVVFGESCRTANGNQLGVAVKFGAAAVAANDQMALYAISTVTGLNSYLSRTMRRNVSAAAQVVKMQYRADGLASSVHEQRALAIRPIRVG